MENIWDNITGNLVELSDTLTNNYLNNYCDECPIVKYLISPEVAFEVLQYLLSNYNKFKGKRKKSKTLDIKGIIIKEKEKIIPLLNKLVNSKDSYKLLREQAIIKKQPEVIIEFFEMFEGSKESEIKKYFRI